MCTYTAIIHKEIGLHRQSEELSERVFSPYRLAFNRDESRKRPAGLPPSVVKVGETRAIFPLDPQGKGTWIGVNEFGLSAAVLNYNPDPGARPPFHEVMQSKAWVSRGGLVPQALRHSSANQALQELGRGSYTEYLPFRLVLLDGYGQASILWNGEEMQVEMADWGNAPLFFTSSGMGDELVDRIRRPFFQTTFPQATAESVQQDEFHANRWEGRAHVSICMDRHDARTVSYSVIEVDHSRISFLYNDHPPCENGKIPVTFQHAMHLTE